MPIYTAQDRQHGAPERNRFPQHLFPSPCALSCITLSSNDAIVDRYMYYFNSRTMFFRLLQPGLALAR